MDHVPNPKSADQELWNLIFETHLGELYSLLRTEVARNGVAHRVEVDDLVQTASCRLIEKGDPQEMWKRSRPERRAYLKCVARSVVVDWLRNQQAKKRGSQYQQVSLKEETNRHADLVNWGSGPERSILMKERLKGCLDHCKKQLKGRNYQRDFEVFLWSKILGLTGREISQRLNGELPTKSVQALLSRIKMKVDRNAGVVDASGAGDDYLYCQKAMIEWTP